MKETSLALALSMLSFMLAVIWGGPLIRILRYFKIGKLIRVEGPDTHIVKMGTPTFGGVMVILPVALLTFLLNAAALLVVDAPERSLLLLLGVMFAYALLGATDDWEGIRGPAQRARNARPDEVHHPGDFCGDRGVYSEGCVPGDSHDLARHQRGL